MVVHACNPSIQEAETDHKFEPGLHRDPATKQNKKAVIVVIIIFDFQNGSCIPQILISLSRLENL
jgi:hypothetical protein